MATIGWIIVGCVGFAALVAFAAIRLGSNVERDIEKTRANAEAQMAVTDGEREEVA